MNKSFFSKWHFPLCQSTLTNEILLFASILIYLSNLSRSTVDGCALAIMRQISELFINKARQMSFEIFRAITAVCVETPVIPNFIFSTKVTPAFNHQQVLGPFIAISLIRTVFEHRLHPCFVVYKLPHTFQECQSWKASFLPKEENLKQTKNQKSEK